MYEGRNLQIALPIAVIVVLLLIAIIVGCIIVVLYMRKRAKSRQESISTDPEYVLVSLNGSLRYVYLFIVLCLLRGREYKILRALNPGSLLCQGS